MPEEKMRGVITQLKTYNDKGLEIGSELTFTPFCDWYMEDLRDGYAATIYDHIGVVINEFGLDVAEKVMEGDMVEVDRDVPENFSKLSCQVSQELIKQTSPVRYPITGTKEYLIRKPMTI